MTQAVLNQSSHVNFRRDSGGIGTESDNNNSRVSFDMDSTIQSDTSAGLSGNILFGSRSALFSFLDALKTKPNKYMYYMYYCVLMISSLPLAIPPDLPWGKIMSQVMSGIHVISTFGLQYSNPLTFKILIALFFSIYIILFGLGIIAIRLFTTGSSNFNRLKSILHIALLVVSMFSIQLTYVYSSFLVCDYRGYSDQPKFNNQNCLSSKNVVWVVLGIICIVSHFLISSVCTYTLTVVSPRDSFFSMDTFTFNFYSQTFWIVFSILRVVTSHFVWLRPLLMMIQSLISLLIILIMVPFFHKRANSLEFGLTLGRFLMCLVSLVLSFINEDSVDRIAGIATGSVAIGSMLGGFIFGIACMEVYMWVICKRGLLYEEKIRHHEARTVSSFIVDIFVRLSMASTMEDVVRAEKLCKLCSLHGFESSYCFYNQALINGYIKKDAPVLSTKLLKKALACRPSYFRHFFILCRYSDLEMEIGIDSDINKIFKMIMSGKQKQKEYFDSVIEFWQLLVEKKIDSAKLNQISEHLEACSTSLERIYTNMFEQWGNRPDVVRSYADYMENIKWDKFLAGMYREDAEDLENHSQRLQRIKQSAFLKNIKGNSVVPVHEDQKEDCKISHIQETKDMSTINITPVQQDMVLQDFELDSDEELDSAANLTQKMTSKEILRQLILTMKPQRTLRLILVSFTIVIILFLLSILLLNIKGLGSGFTTALINGCNMQVVSYNILNSWRSSQFNTLFDNYTHLGNMTYNMVLPSISRQSDLLSEYLREGLYSTFSTSNARKHILVGLEYPVAIPLVNGHNITSYSINATIYDVVRSYREAVSTLTRANLLSTVDSYSFLFFWLNRRTLSDNLTTYCQVFYDEYIFNEAIQKKIFGWILGVVGAFNISYLPLIFFPCLIYFLRERRRVLLLFGTIPKNVVGGVVHRLKESCLREENRSPRKKQTYLTPKFKLGCLILIALMIEGVCIFLCIYDSSLRIFNNNGTTELVLHTGFVSKSVNQVTFAVRELVFAQYFPLLDYKFPVEEVVRIANDGKKSWDILRFGVGTKSGEGFIGFDKTIDNLITDDICLPHLLSALDQKKFYCRSLNFLLESAIVRGTSLIFNYKQMSLEEQLSEFNDLEAIARAFTTKLDRVTSLFAKKSDETAGLLFPIEYIYLIAFVILLVLIVLMNSAINHERRINHEIRKLLYFLPEEDILGLPEVSNFINTYSFLAKRRVVLDETDKTKAILDGSTDGVIICDANGVITEANSAVKTLFQLSDVDIIGASVSTLFRDSDVLLAIKELVKCGKGLNREYNAVSKKTGEFPSKVSMSTGLWGTQQVVALFIRDCTIENKQTQLINQEKKNSENLLLNILPAPVAMRLKRGDSNISENVDDATCFFSDMVGFTKLSSTMVASELVELLNDIVNTFDDLCLEHELEKIKTIGDAYFAVGGLSGASNHTERVIRFALDAIKSLDKFQGKIQIRCGCHTGPLVCGVIGKSKFAFDVWGDTVNIASRMESTGLPGKVQCSRSAYERTHDVFHFEERYGIYVKGVGEMTCYIVTAPKHTSHDSQRRGSMSSCNSREAPRSNLLFEDLGGTTMEELQDPNSSSNFPSLTEETLLQHQQNQ